VSALRRLPVSGRAGFTLVEVIVALAILAMIGVITFTTISTTLHARDYLEEDDVQNQSARIALARIKKDLELAWLTPNVQAVNSFRTLFVARDGNPDQLWFNTLSHQRLYRDARECDETEVTYWTEDDPNNHNALVLLRREAPHIDQEPDKGGSPMPLAYGLRTFDITLLDPTTNEWKNEWDTTGADTPGRLPRAARVLLELYGPDPDDDSRQKTRSYFTTVILQFGPPLAKDLLTGNGSSAQ